MTLRQQLIACTIGMVMIVFSGACRKKTPVASVPPVPQPAAAPAPVKPNAPTISEFVAEPRRIERGQSAVLRWEVRDATRIQIDQGMGTVSASGKRTISPNNSITYTLTATGDGGTATAAATLSVTAPSPPVEVQTAPVRPLGERLSSEVQDAYFDFDKYYIREDAVLALTNDAAALKMIFKDFPDTTVIVEGHCDERGSAEYNLGLGDRRASSVKEFLEQLGIPRERLITVSYVKERPQCTQADETCWQRNRRVHFAPGENQKKQAGDTAESSAGKNAPLRSEASGRPEQQ
jgi:peptidoglycan-associated lipoprotein